MATPEYVYNPLENAEAIKYKNMLKKRVSSHQWNLN